MKHWIALANPPRTPARYHITIAQSLLAATVAGLASIVLFSVPATVILCILALPVPWVFRLGAQDAMYKQHFVATLTEYLHEEKDLVVLGQPTLALDLGWMRATVGRSNGTTGEVKVQWAPLNQATAALTADAPKGFQPIFVTTYR